MICLFCGSKKMHFESLYKVKNIYMILYDKINVVLNNENKVI